MANVEVVEAYQRNHQRKRKGKKRNDFANEENGQRRISNYQQGHAMNLKDKSIDTERKTVDANTMQYFLEISSLLGTQSSIDDTEEKATLIANALEETHGKEVELSCEKSCSRVLEMLIHASDTNQVVSFLHRASPKFPIISMDASGSHVAETLLKATAILLHDYDGEAAWFKTLNEGLQLICRYVGERARDMMCSCYGSHVTRSLLSLLTGIKFEESNKKYGGRLNNRPDRLSHMQKLESIQKQGEIIFPDLFQLLAEKLLEAAKRNTLQLCKDPFASPVLQALLKIMAADSFRVAKAIKILLGCSSKQSNENESTLHGFPSANLKELIFDNCGSHLVEVMLEVAPDALYMEIFQEISTHHILEYALHQSANFVVQALITSIRNLDQLNSLLAELNPNFSTLIKGMRSGIIVSILNVCKKFHSNEGEVCRLLGKALSPEGSCPPSLVSRLLFLESYARSNCSLNWNPQFGTKMSVLGCTMLQLIFQFREECNQQFWLSLISMEATDLVWTVKDPGGCHVIESFLLSTSPWKQKNRLLSKLKGYFGELAKQTCSSFTVEKCFSVGKLDLKEAITSELALVQMELGKTKHGPHLVKKFDVTGYSKAPEQWRKRMAAKEGTLKAFSDVFKDGGRFESTDQSDQDKHQDSDRRRVKDSNLDTSIDVKKRKRIQ